MSIQQDLKPQNCLCIVNKATIMLLDNLITLPCSHYRVEMLEKQQQQHSTIYKAAIHS